MPTITNLAELKAHGPAIHAELNAVFAKYGLTIDRRSARIDSTGTEISWKIETKSLDTSKVEDKEKKTWDIYAPMEGLSADMFGKKFKAYDGTVYQIVGCQPRKPKNFVKVIRVRDGRPFQGPVGFIKTAKFLDEVAA